MGDRAWTAISFAGVIDEDKAELLLKACKSDWLMCDDNLDVELTLEHLQSRLSNAEVNYAQLEATESACAELGVSYCKEWQDGASYGPGIEIYSAVTGVTFEVGTIEGEAALTADDIKKAGSIEAAIDYLNAFHNFEENYGKLEIKKSVNDEGEKR